LQTRIVHSVASVSVAAGRLQPSGEALFVSEAAAQTLEDLSAVTDDLELPTTGVNGSTVTWSSSDEAVIAPDGTVTRPDTGEPPAEVTLTARLSRGAAVRTRELVATVLPLPGAEELAQEDLAAIDIPNADDVRGNITLPAVGPVHGSPVAWSATPEGVITTTDADGVRAGVVTRGTSDTSVTLTATVPGTDAVREIDVVVRAAPTDLDTDYTAG